MLPEHDPGAFFPHQRHLPIDESEQLYLPRSIREPIEKVELYWIEQFLSPEECAALLPIIDAHGERSTTTEGDEVRTNELRTSDSANLGELGDPLVADIDERICRYMGIHWSHGEGLQAQSYEVGEEFKQHFDFNSETSKLVEDIGQRTWTFMIFLNEVEQGGETEFPRLGIQYTPRQGSAIVWRNLDLAGSPNPFTLHAGKPVLKGRKAIITKWFRQKSADATQKTRFTKCAGEYLPAYSGNDMQKVLIPPQLLQEIRDFKDGHLAQAQKEIGTDDFIKSQSGVASELIDLPLPLRERLHTLLKPILESWVQLPLTPSLVYGVRRYYRGALLESHIDTYNTHRISATLNIDQQVDEPWPLYVRDTFYRQHAVYLEPGEMLLYEGARLEHGRPLPLQGDFYDSVFVHYYP